MKPQTVEVLTLLRARGSLGVTPHDAAQIGCWRLAARVWELRADGFVITDEGKGFARYVLTEAPEQLTLARAREAWDNTGAGDGCESVPYALTPVARPSPERQGSFASIRGDGSMTTDVP